MIQNIEKVKISVDIDNNNVYNFSGKINEQTIIQCAKDVEEILKYHNVEPSKLQNVYELTVEIMQNILNYSYNSKEIGDNKREADGDFLIKYNSTNQEYILKSSNLIKEKDEAIIYERVKVLEGLDDRELRKYARVKMREQKDKHQKGAGLGFVVMARKSLKPIKIKFKKFENDIKKFKLKLVV